MKGIFAIDPGINTGVAWCVVDEKSATVKVALQNKVNAHSTTIDGDPYEQMRELFRLWETFKTECVVHGGLEPGDVELVIEQFIMFPGQHAAGTEGSACERIGWAFEGYRVGRAVKYKGSKHVTVAVFQPPNAMRNKRHLKAWDCWVPGREHERSAWCHVGERLRKLIR